MLPAGGVLALHGRTKSGDTETSSPGSLHEKSPEPTVMCRLSKEITSPNASWHAVPVGMRQPLTKTPLAESRSVTVHDPPRYSRCA